MPVHFHVICYWEKFPRKPGWRDWRGSEPQTVSFTTSSSREAPADWGGREAIPNTQHRGKCHVALAACRLTEAPLFCLASSIPGCFVSAWPALGLGLTKPLWGCSNLSRSAAASRRAAAQGEEWAAVHSELIWTRVWAHKLCMLRCERDMLLL